MKNNTSRNRLNTQLRGIGISVLTAFLIVGCATTSVPDSEREPQPGAGDGIDLEEIVVTGQSSDERRRDESKSSSENRMREMTEQQQAVFSRRYRAGFGRMGPAGTPPPQEVLAHVSQNEEVWIITRPDVADNADDDDAEPGSGSMLIYVPGEDGEPAVEVPLPLKHTAVTANVDGYVSTVNVRQSFENPYAEKIEVVYLFPLPEKSAVNEFLMTIGERQIRGILREKKEAEAIYNEARRQGYQASLLVQRRPNVFEQKVANIEPGKAIDVDIRYFHTLAYKDGWYSFVFPTVVGPRFNPPGSADPIEARSRGAVPTGNTAVTYLRPQERSGHDISIEVQIDAGVNIEELRSTHAIVESRPTAETMHVELANQRSIPNRDFVLDFKVTGDTVRSNLLTYRNPETGQGYFTMMLYPPATTESLRRQPMEMVFVIDCSGSMSGRPIEQAKNAVYAALSHLQPGDSFQIIRFSEHASQLGTRPLEATPRNIAHARQYLRRLSGTGGTMMGEGVKAALDFPHDSSRMRFVSFMTDGYIGNEAEIIGSIHRRIGHSRIFSFGVGTSVNRYLLERMAQEGRGAVAYLGLQDSGGDIMSAFFKRISQPALTDVHVDWGNMQVSDVYPSVLPDLFVGRPLVVTGKYNGTPSTLSVSGLAANQTRQFVVGPGAREGTNANIAKLWARLRIADLSDRQSWEQDQHGELESAIRNTALEYQLMSAYTSFVAVDASARTAGDHGTTVQQPVPVPDGVRYETTVNH